MTMISLNKAELENTEIDYIKIDLLIEKYILNLDVSDQSKLSYRIGLSNFVAWVKKTILKI